MEDAYADVTQTWTWSNSDPATQMLKSRLIRPGNIFSDMLSAVSVSPRELQAPCHFNVTEITFSLQHVYLMNWPLSVCVSTVV